MTAYNANYVELDMFYSVFATEMMNNLGKSVKIIQEMYPYQFQLNSWIPEGLT